MVFTGNFFVLPYNSSLSIRFIVGLLALMTVILFNGYTTALTSFLTVQKLNPVVNSFQELASSKQYHLVAPLLSFMSTFFLVYWLFFFVILIFSYYTAHDTN